MPGSIFRPLNSNAPTAMCRSQYPWSPAFPVWSKNSSSFPVSNKRKFFNADEFIKGSGQDDAAQGTNLNSQWRQTNSLPLLLRDICPMRWELGAHMVKKLMRPHGSKILTVHPVGPEYERIGSPRFLDSPAASVPHCLFPDDILPLGLEYWGSERGETSGGKVLRL